MSRVLDVLRGSLPPAYGVDQDDTDRRVHELLSKVAAAREQALHSLSLKDVATHSPEG